MKIYYWKHENYKFSLEIGERQHRWGNEGILQDVSLKVNNKILYHNNWGVESALDSIISGIYNHDIFNRRVVDDKDIPFYIFDVNSRYFLFPVNVGIGELENKIFDDFYKWLKSHLGTINEQREIKISKLKSKVS